MRSMSSDAASVCCLLFDFDATPAMWRRVFSLNHGGIVCEYGEREEKQLRLERVAGHGDVLEGNSGDVATDVTFFYWTDHLSLFL